MTKKTSYKKRIEELRKLVDIQCQPGTQDYDSYSRGLANGLILALHTMLDREGTPHFIDTPEKYLSGELTPAQRNELLTTLYASMVENSRAAQCIATAEPLAQLDPHAYKNLLPSRSGWINLIQVTAARSIELLAKHITKSSTDTNI